MGKWVASKKGIALIGFHKTIRNIQFPSPFAATTCVQSLSNHPLRKFFVQDSDKLSFRGLLADYKYVMTPRPRYQVERIQALIAEIAEFNSHDIRDMELTQNGEPIAVSSEMMDEWRLIGLSNKEFVELEYWKACRQC